MSKNPEEPHLIVDAKDLALEKYLQTDPAKGLSDEEVKERLAQFGPNGKLRA
jgi:hypothetical protein